VLAELVGHLLRYPETLKKMGESGRRHYVAEFAEDTVMNQLIGLIQTTSALPSSP